MEFIWDPKKAVSNERKHGVSFDEAASAFSDRLGAYFADGLHDDRIILIGVSRENRTLYVVHAEILVDTIRIISARKATSREKARYEAG